MTKIKYIVLNGIQIINYSIRFRVLIKSISWTLFKIPKYKVLTLDEITSPVSSLISFSMSKAIIDTPCTMIAINKKLSFYLKWYAKDKLQHAELQYDKGRNILIR